MSFGGGDQLLNGRNDFIDQGLLRLSQSGLGEEFKMLLGLENLAKPREV